MLPSSNKTDSEDNYSLILGRLRKKCVGYVLYFNNTLKENIIVISESNKNKIIRRLHILACDRCR